MDERLWILGAGDPEMEAIEGLLRSVGENVVYAMNSGKRVHPGNAYKGEISSNTTSLSATEIFLVECEVPVMEGVWWTVIDHHRPGDPGYGQPPENFWEASSVGQVFAKLEEIYGEHFADEQSVNQLRLVAAADHCLGSAYRGECPGIDPNALMEWRIRSRAKFQNRPVEEVMRDVEKARKALRAASRVAELPGHVADFRSGTIPELPEAAAREGIAFLAEMNDRGRRKVVLQAANSKQVAKFLVTYPAVGKYGDPARGFAGGYLE